MGSSKAEEPRPSAQDIALADRAAADDRIYVQQFMPLEVFEIEQFRDPAVRQFNRDIIAGRISADVAAEERKARAAAITTAQSSGTKLGSGANASALSRTSDAVAHAVNSGKIEASQEARNIQDAEGLSVLRTGNDLGRGNTQSLADAARRETYSATDRLRNETELSSVRAKALGDIASVAVVGGADAWKRGRDGNVKDDDLSLGAQAVRNIFGTRAI